MNADRKLTGRFTIAFIVSLALRAPSVAYCDVVVPVTIPVSPTHTERFDDDEDFKTRAREGVVKLQAGNPEEVAAWESLCAASRVEFEKIYALLNISNGLTERGESFYNPFLGDVVKELEEMDNISQLSIWCGYLGSCS